LLDVNRAFSFQKGLRNLNLGHRYGQKSLERIQVNYFASNG